MRRAALLLLVGLAAVGVLLLFVFPARTLLSQRRQISRTEQRIAALRREDAALAARVRGLRSPQAVEQLAHQDFGMVLQGQKSYTIVPAAPNTPTTTTTPAAPTRSASGQATGAKRSVVPAHGATSSTTAPAAATTVHG